MSGLARIPVDLLTPEQREQRIAELRRALTREWLRYAVVEAVVLLLPFAAFLVWFTTSGAGAGALILAIAAFACASALLVVLWMARRITPIMRELAELGVASSYEAEL